MASNYDAIPVGVAVAAPVDENVATGTPVEVEDNNRFNWMAKTIAAVTVLVAVATVYWVVVGWNDMTNVTFTTNKWGVDGNRTS